MTKPEALELIAQVCSDYHRAQPDVINWRVSKSHRYSSGHWQPYYAPRKSWRSPLKPRAKLVITAGTGGSDHKETLLHELAHHLIGRTKAGRRVGHPVRFWKLHYELCNHYGVDTPDHKRNVNYKAKAEVGRNKAIAKSDDGTLGIAELLQILS